MLLLLPLLLLAPLARPADAEPAAATPIAEIRPVAAANFVTALEELAGWCDEEKLQKFRDQCYVAILAAQPNHEGARKALKYRRDGDGWKQVGYREPGNFPKEKGIEAEFEPKYRAIVDEYVNTILDTIEAAPPKSEPESRQLAIDDVLAVEPDNARARHLNGEASLNGKWVLIETARAKARFDELRDLAKEVKDSIDDPANGETQEDELKLGVDFKATLVGERWRGVGATSEAELRRIVKTLDAVEPLMHRIFGLAEPKRTGPSTMYLLAGQEQAEKLLTAHPSFSEAQRKYLLQLKAAWIGSTRNFVQWNDEQDVRLDGATRNVISLSLMKQMGISTKNGWLWEGLGLYIDYLLTGSRRTIYVTRALHTTSDREEKLDIERRMKQPGANWMKLAREMLDQAADPDLRAMTRLEVNQMTAETLIYSYALASYVLEATPEVATKFFLMQGSDQALEDTIRAVYDMDLPNFRKKFERWLREMTDR